MRLFLPAVMAILLVLFFLPPTDAAGAADGASFCTEGERRMCGWNEGVCQSGRSVCQAGNWTECAGGIKPKEAEICGNGIDDDCNGAIDENCFPWLSLVLVGTGIFFIGIGMIYMQKGKGERMIREGVSRD